MPSHRRRELTQATAVLAAATVVVSLAATAGWVSAQWIAPRTTSGFISSSPGTPPPAATLTTTPTVTPEPPPTLALTPAATQTACPDYDADTICDDVDEDDDNDGCKDVAELQPREEAAAGGGRNPTYFWDVMDLPIGVPAVRDRAVTIGDIGGVVARFGATREPPPSKEQAFAEALEAPPPAPAYHAAFDRAGPIAGQDLWDLMPPDGMISIVDIGAAVAQFGHSCA